MKLYYNITVVKGLDNEVEFRKVLDNEKDFLQVLGQQIEIAKKQVEEDLKQLNFELPKGKILIKDNDLTEIDIPAVTVSCDYDFIDSDLTSEQEKAIFNVEREIRYEIGLDLD